jgi:hypothetical protein
MPEYPGHANPHERGVMDARRMAGAEAPDSDSATPSLDQTILALYPDLVRELQTQLVDYMHEPVIEACQLDYDWVRPHRELT